MLNKKVLIGISIALTAVLFAACTPTTDPITVTRVVESDVTREISPPEPEENEPIQITRQVPDPTATAEPTPVPEPTPVQIETSSSPVQGNVTFNGYLTEDVASFDPQIAQDPTGINYVENLFVSLTKYDLVTAEVLPEAATSWDISQDGLEYSFYLRTDIPWVYHNPVSGETIQAIDGDGRPRFVTAHDFAYSIRRACDPNIATYFNRVIAPVIVGCEEVLNAVDPGNISEEAIAAIGVEALDEATLVIQLNYPAAHFLSMTPMSTLAASPEWTIIKYGRIWTEAGTIVTSGPYVLHEWIHSNRIILLRNPFMPEDMQGTGNIDRHVVTILPDVETGYSLWQNHEVDISSLPDSELYTHPAQFPDETLRVPDLAVFYISFRMTKPPFDNVHVRRAFSAAFDREMFINETRNGLGLPMRHFAPPGIFGAPPINEIGVGFDPEFARAELEAAGYPNCEGFPQVTFLGYSGQSTLDWLEFAQAQWEEHLGCTAYQIHFEQAAFSELLAATDPNTGDEIAPHMWTLGWGPDYADENNWVGDVLGCNTVYNREKRSCNEIDELITEARQELDPARRIELYAQIEETLFGPQGEYPLMPLFVRANFQAIQSWYDYTPALFGGDQFYNDTIDMEAKQAVQR